MNIRLTAAKTFTYSNEHDMTPIVTGKQIGRAHV